MSKLWVCEDTVIDWLPQSENTRLTHSKFCVLALGLTQVLTCSFSAPFHSGSRLVTSLFQSVSHALQLCWVPHEILFKCDICCHGDCVIPISLIEKIIHFFVLSLRLELVNKNSKEHVVLLRLPCIRMIFSFLASLCYLGPSREFDTKDYVGSCVKAVKSLS